MMNNKKQNIFNLILLFITITYAQDTCSGYQKKPVKNSGFIIVSVENIKNRKGLLKGCLFSSEKGFPKDYSQASVLAKTRIEDTSSTKLVFRDVEFGKPAFVIIHDEDEDLKLKTGLFSIPKEGYCFSNNAKGFLGPPGFEKASFDFSTDTLYLSVKMINH